MARGGRRPGSGRKPGSANKRTREVADKAAADGITPLEVMLNTMKALWEDALDDDGKLANIEKALAACSVGKDAERAALRSAYSSRAGPIKLRRLLSRAKRPI